MDSIVPLLLMFAAAIVVLARSVMAVVSMSHLTCSAIAWPWMLQGVAALWVVCSILTGDAEYRPWAVSAFVVAAAAVLVVDRRRPHWLRLKKARRLGGRHVAG